MSEEILKALAQLYAIIAKQDGGETGKQREFVIKSFTKKINQDAVASYVGLYDSYCNDGKEKKADDKEKLTSVKDSVKTLAICRKINKTLTQKQKVVVLCDLLEMVKADNDYSPQRKQIIETVAEVFNIQPDEHKILEALVLSSNIDDLNAEGILIVNNLPQDQLPPLAKHLPCDIGSGSLIFLYVKSVEMTFFKHTGGDIYHLNGMLVEPKDVILFPQGSILKTGKGKTFFYSDIIAQFHSELKEICLSFNVKDVQYTFPNGKVGLRDINFSEGPGKLIGIMGASGAGKTTLLNVLAGLEHPSKGEVLLNGVNIHTHSDLVHGAIGYVSQDDLLIEELSVFDNLYYNAQLCFKHLSKQTIAQKVESLLEQLGLIQAKDLKVGNPLNKTISGGQRKRLNIALELIREPGVLFLDEPTSGLSSRDSENVIDLLKELSLKGTLIFVVIHQPSSDIYKMFDKIFILDTGGYPVFYGNPIEAVTWFKKISMHADHEKGQCETCGSVNPEQIFNIIEERVVDEYGNYTNKRKISTDQWYSSFKESYDPGFLEDQKGDPPGMLDIPGRLKQWLVFSTRDLFSKISNTQYLLINLLEAPVLALILGFIIRYNNTSDGGYLYRYNENIPAYLLMSVVVAIFMGLSVSAEEIIRDRKILKREAFLNLSRFSYLSSKLLILFSLSAIQTLLFVIVGNSLLGIKGMYLTYWLVLFSTSCMANMLGLLISSGLNSAVTVYILIPLLLIPQMILSGAMFSFDKINDLFKNKEKVPLVADVMVSRWAFEALAVEQFLSNKYQKPIHKFEMIESLSGYNLAYLLPELRARLEYNGNNHKNANDSVAVKISKNLHLVRNELLQHAFINDKIDVADLNAITTYNVGLGKELEQRISELEDIYNRIFMDASKQKEAAINTIGEEKVNLLKDHYFNESLSDFVRNVRASKRIVEVDDHLAANIDLVYLQPKNTSAVLGYRSHFCAPVKNLFGAMVSTYTFNIIVIWLCTILFFIILYFDLLKKGFELPATIKQKFRPKK